MKDKYITIYTASAGAGKTFKLVYKYIEFLFLEQLNYIKTANPDSWVNDSHRFILAVTFTNKATIEMKNRIVAELYNLSISKGAYFNDLIANIPQLKKTTKSETQRIVADVSKKLLADILLHYSMFNVLTIDMFFQSIVRTFAFELGIYNKYNIVLEKEEIASIYEQSVDELFNSLGNDNYSHNMLKWLKSVVDDNIVSENKGWNPAKNIDSFINQVIGNEVYTLTKNDFNVSLQKVQTLLENINNEIKSLQKQINAFVEQRLLPYCHLIESPAINAHIRTRLNPDYAYNKVLDAEDYLTATQLNSATSGLRKNIISETNAKKIGFNVDESFFAALCRDLCAIHNYKNNDLVRRYYTLSAIRSPLSMVGILRKIEENISDFCIKNDIVMMQSTAEFINNIVSNTTVPFIYERTGQNIHHYMIDEFQDTSKLQWRNFTPLFHDAVANGRESMIVGDVKQSIYRWRNGDWKILQYDVDQEFRGQTEHIPLSTNYRSARNIVEFNNRLYSQQQDGISLPQIKAQNYEFNLSEFYDAYQHVHATSKGYVSCKLDYADIDEKLNDVISCLITIKQQGLLGRTAMLLRTNNQRDDIVPLLREHNIPFVSSEALNVASDFAVKFVVAMLEYICNRASAFSRLNLVAAYSFIKNSRAINCKDYDKIYACKQDMFNPKSFEERLFEDIDITPIFVHCGIEAIVESIIRVFNLYETNSGAHTPYLRVFAEKVSNYATTHHDGILPFLKFWSREGDNTFIEMSELPDALQILTIHKSKGLEFDILLLPFLTSKKRNDVTLLVDTHDIKISNDIDLNGIPLLPVRKNKIVECSQLKEQFDEEALNNDIDNLNLLYVATTRAKHQLHIFCQQDEIPELQTALSASTYAVGDINDSFAEIKTKIESRKASETILLNDTDYNLQPVNRLLNVEDWRFSYMRDENQNNKKRNFGIQCHHLLENITSKFDIQDVIQEAIAQGDIRRDDASLYMEVLYKLFDNAIFASWFNNPDYRHLNEISVIDTSLQSNIYRVDKLLVDDKNKKAIVIDYKFVSSKANHTKYQNQVNHYMQIMRAMGYDVEGFLVYANQNEIIKIQ